MTEPHGGRRNDIVARLARAQLGCNEDDVRKAILRGFAEHGRAPNVRELAHVLGITVESVREACRTLAGYDLIVWRDDEARIVSAYPFSGLRMSRASTQPDGSPRSWKSHIWRTVEVSSRCLIFFRPHP